MSDMHVHLDRVRERIAAAARAAGRSPEEITLIGVTKTFPAEVINAAIAVGIRDIGENRIQEARDKFPALTGEVRRHMIGHLQRNKVKYAVKLFDMIQSVDRLSLAEEINVRSGNLGRRMPVLIEVNTSGEDAKSGCAPSEALTLLEAVARLPHIEVQGFMTIAALSDDETVVRGCFRRLREIFETARSRPLPGVELRYLSMGMSSDFEMAIAEGANMVRIGSAIFGSRT